MSSPSHETTGPAAPAVARLRAATRRVVILCLVCGAAAWALYSYATGGLMAALLETSGTGSESIERLRAHLARWGALAPLVYVAAVIVEVMLAPIPGTLLYAPAGALFGGGLGGTLSLAGNVIGATLASLVARALGERLTARLDAGSLTTYRRRLADRGGWIIFLLRVNPLTSSDLVSYAAGLAGVPAWKVAAGTFAGMAPLCYAQAYFADRLFRVLPGSLWIVATLGLAYAAAVVWVLIRLGRRRTRSGF